MENKLKDLITELYLTRDRLKELFNNEDEERLKFTLDGNLIGDIGEGIARYHFDLELLPRGTKVHDAVTRNEPKKYVQIKTTQGKRVGLGLNQNNFDYLIVISIDPESRSYSIVYNGPGKLIWENINSNSISTSSLGSLNEKVDIHDRVPLRKDKG
jgi:hypothetical protein